MPAVFDFKGHHALITGGSRGIGKAVAALLYKSGCKITIVDKQDPSHLKSEFPGMYAITADLGNWKETEAKLQAHLDEGHQIDLLVNNVGISILQSAGEVTEEVLDKIIAVNTKSAVVVSQLIANQLVKRKQPGSIVNLSSQAALRGFLAHMSYGISKAGVDQVTRHLAVEFGPHGIRANSVNPTVVETDMGKTIWSEATKRTRMMEKIPLGRFAEAEEIANVIVFLLSDLSSMVNGIIMPIDGGFLSV